MYQRYKTIWDRWSVSSRFVLTYSWSKTNKVEFTVLYQQKENCLYGFKHKRKEEFYRDFWIETSYTFETAGLTLGPAGKTVILRDESHPAIILLDNSLTFKRCLSDATNNLEKPTSIAWYKDRLCVVDGQNILILECKIENKKHI